MKKPILLSILLLGFCFKLFSQEKIWQEQVSSPLIAESLLPPVNDFDLYTLNIDLLQSILSGAKSKKEIAGKENYLTLSFPIAGHGLQHFDIFEAPVMATGLQTKYPTIKTYTGQSLEHPQHIIKFDIGPAGFHAMVFAAGVTYLIEPAYENDWVHYTAFRKQDLITAENQEFTCLVSESNIPFQAEAFAKSSSNPSGPELRTYQLALGATGEYSTFHGGTKPLVLNAMVTAINRVNGIFERDFTITMQLVNNTDTLIYLDPDSDPYTNNNLGAMLGENQQLCDSLIGFDNYGIGHIFGTAGGGLAGVNVVCGGAKAWGATGLNAPTGDYFSVDYVSHEIGHQFGGGHTFNECGGQAGQAYEPGSGVTIMAYAGLCGSSNLQGTSIDQFHVATYDQVINYSQMGNGNSCPLITETNNTAPTIILPEGDFYIPYATPFELTGIATDLEGDSLTYCWEQFDLGPSVHPDSATGTAPLFRSWSPVSHSTRIFPRISDLVNNTHTIGELLPQFGRELNFRMTVRDNVPGGGGVNYEQITFHSTDSSGHFQVVSPNGGQIWTVGQLETINWDVANSNQFPVNCLNVDILLSVDGGYTYPHIIAANRPNNGAAVITVPDIISNETRIKVKAANNIFFDISNNNNYIFPAANPDFIITVNDPTETICGNQTVEFSIDLDTIMGFDDPVALAIFGNPAGTVFSFSEDVVVPPANVILTVMDTLGLAAGDYTVTLQASSTSGVKNLPLTLKIRTEEPAPVSLVSPFNGNTNVASNTVFSWNPIPFVYSYTIEVSEFPGFPSLFYSASGISNNAVAPSSGLNPNTIYYWRVKVDNSDCGEGPWSPVFSFQTEITQCATYSSQDVPVSISGSGTPTEYSELEISQDIFLTDVNVINLFGNHTWVGDLNFSLLSPSGDSVLLFGGICGSEDDFNVSFDDLADPGDIPCPPTTGLTYQPFEALSLFNTSNALGTWTLKIYDSANQDGGMLQRWSLELCGPPVSASLPNITLLPDSVAQGGILTVMTNKLQGDCDGSTDNLEFVITSLPLHGTLLLDGITATVGMVFTQSDVDNNLLSYEHNNLNTDTDQFEFILSCEDGVYIGGLVYSITVLPEMVGTLESYNIFFTVYPNPALDYFELIIEDSNNGGLQVELIDMLGRIVLQKNINRGKTRISSSMLSGGIYSVIIRSRGHVVGEDKLVIIQ